MFDRPDYGIVKDIKITEFKEMNKNAEISVRYEYEYAIDKNNDDKADIVITRKNSAKNIAIGDKVKVYTPLVLAAPYGGRGAGLGRKIVKVR